jgi:hypothetical protein
MPEKVDRAAPVGLRVHKELGFYPKGFECLGRF